MTDRPRYGRAIYWRRERDCRRARRNPPATAPAQPLCRCLQASALRAWPDRAARWRRTTALPTAAILRAAPPDLQSAPRHRLCVFPPGLPWHGLLLPLTRPADPARSSRRILVAADAFENTAVQTPLSGATPPRLP